MNGRFPIEHPMFEGELNLCLELALDSIGTWCGILDSTFWISFFFVLARGESSARQNFQAKPNIQTQSWHRTLSLEHARQR